jgi:hypothetical protein
MAEITLKKGRLSSALRMSLSDYYSKIPGLDPAYLDSRWEKWRQDRSITPYLVKKDAETVGWIVYNRATSAIEEMSVKGSEEQARIRSLALDALIAKESERVGGVRLSPDQEDQCLRPFPGQDGTEYGCPLPESQRMQTFQDLSQEGAGCHRAGSGDTDGSRYQGGAPGSVE